MIWRTAYKMKPPIGAKLVKGHTLARELVGCWPMNECGGLSCFDLSRNRNTGSIGSNILWVPAKFGLGLELGTSGLGANDSIIVTDCVGHTAQQGTILMWFKITTFQDGNGIISAKHSDGNHCLKILEDATNGCLDIEYYNTVGVKTIEFSSTAGSIIANRWYFMAFTWSLAAGRIYLNGSLNAEDTEVAGTLRLLDDIWIGSNVAGWATGLGGLIDNVIAYNRQLSAAEIRQLYSEPFCMFDWSWLFDVPSAVPPEAAAAWLAWLQQDWFLRHGHRAQVPPGIIDSGAAWFARGLQDWWLRYGRPAELPRPPRKAAALWMDLESQDWFLRHSVGQYAKI